MTASDAPDRHYRTTHDRLRRTRGPAKDYPCVSCGGPAREWAYQYTGTVLRDSQQNRAYSEDPADYAPMCSGCHRSFDNSNDADVQQRRLDGSRKAGRTTAARLQEDPEFAQEFSRKVAAGGRATAARAQGDPAFASEKRLGEQRGRDKTNAMRLRCTECGRETTPGPMAKHLKTHQHEGAVPL